MMLHRSRDPQTNKHPQRSQHYKRKTRPPGFELGIKKREKTSPCRKRKEIQNLRKSRGDEMGFERRNCVREREGEKRNARKKKRKCKIHVTYH